MKKSLKYRSAGLEALHESMQDLYEINLIDSETMKSFDESCLEDAEIVELDDGLPKSL